MQVMKGKHPVCWVAAVLMCCLIAGNAGSETLTIDDASVSVPQARDGMTISLGYKITSTGSTTATLGATLTGPGSVNVSDVGIDGAPSTASITPGTNWYYRSFPINLPPTAPTGTYYVNYAINWGTSSSAGAPSARSFTMLAPVPVRCPILMYHKIGDALYSQYWNTTSMLRAQMAVLKAYGYTSITMRELMDIRAGITPAPAKPVMLTFDGGYENFYLDALPIVMEYGYKPVMFLLTGIMGMDNSWDGDNNPVIMFMTWDEVTAAYNTGYVDLESHTVTHPDFATLASQGDTAQINQELTDSRDTIRSRYGCPCDFFCYPYGSGYNNTIVRNAIRDNGYFGAVMAWGGVETNSADKYALKRVPIYSNTTTDYDPASSGTFFLNEIGDPLSYPVVNVSYVQFLDPITGSHVTQLKWGQKVKIRVTATNSRTTADAAVTLLLDSDTDATNGAIFDSHEMLPSQDVIATGWLGSRTFEWLWTVPVEAPTGRYTATAQFRDKLYVLGFKKYSCPAFAVTANDVSLESTKNATIGNWIALKDVAVSAAFSDCFYVESGWRTMGLRVEMPNHGITPLTRVDVAGQLTISASGERCISATYVSPTCPDFVLPLGMSHQTLTHDANAVGLLVRTWGRVKSVDQANHVLMISDGSLEDLECVWEDEGLIDPNCTYVTLTGVLSLKKVGENTKRVLLIASAECSSPRQ